jgi:cellobiose phosphorylase
MRLDQIQTRKLLTEGLDSTSVKTVLLWESVGNHLIEANLTPDQITQLFTDIESGATAAGGNRTLVGKGKDATMAVNKAWEDLKTKMQDSGPIENFDQKISDALSKIGMGAKDPKFNGEVNKWVQKYRDFA